MSATLSCLAALRTAQIAPWSLRSSLAFPSLGSFPATSQLTLNRGAFQRIKVASFHGPPKALPSKLRYSYRPLDATGREIRLFELVQEQGPLSEQNLAGSIRHVSLDDNPEYFALLTPGEILKSQDLSR